MNVTKTDSGFDDDDTDPPDVTARADKPTSPNNAKEAVGFYALCKAVCFPGDGVRVRVVKEYHSSYTIVVEQSGVQWMVKFDCLSDFGSSWDRPTGYAKALQAERVKSQEADEKWLVMKPGEHSKTHYRIVRDCGINAVGGKPVFAAICEINTSRTSEDGYSEQTERNRAEAIARDHNEHAALLRIEALALEYSRKHNDPDCEPWREIRHLAALRGKAVAS